MIAEPHDGTELEFDDDMPDEEIDRRVYEYVNGGKRAGSLAEELAALRAEVRSLKAAVMAPRESQLIRDDAGRPQRAISVSLYNGELPVAAATTESDLDRPWAHLERRPA